MKYTKQELIEKIKKNEASFFSEMYFEYGYMSSARQPDTINKFEKIWELNWGDGNDLEVAIKFIDENIIVYMKGYYSSHDESELSYVYFGTPFDFKETRYRKSTPDEIRDLRIEEILN